MAHLPASQFSHVFEPLQGKRIGFVRPSGNVGDMVIEKATLQLFDHFEIKWRYWSPNEPLENLQELVFGGGGNMGNTYRENWDLRTACLETRLPVTILPQSYLGPEHREFHRVYVRDNESFKFATPDAIPAPDLALGLIPEPSPAAKKPLGIFIRKDLEAHETVPWYSEDPVELAQTPEQYLRLAARHQIVITNRLHFAVAGILYDRQTILLPNSYHKNFSIHQTWLSDLGCGFAQSLDEALQQINRRTLGWFSQTRHYLAVQRYRTDLRRAA